MFVVVLCASRVVIRPLIEPCDRLLLYGGQCPRF